MRTVNSSIVRCVCAILVGILLVAWPETAIVYLVIVIGALFLVPGMYSLLGYLMKGRQLGMRFPLVSVGSALFGLWLMISPAFFVGILMYVLGAILVFAGISQIVSLLSARSFANVPVGYYISPVLILLAGLLVLVNPFAAASIPFIILGVSCIVYGVSALVNHLRFRKEEKNPLIEDAEIIEVTPLDENMK